jgi:putative transposase
MSYNNGRHTVFHHRYHIVWITKYRYKVLEGALRERIRTIIKQVCEELGVQIVSGVLSREHIHMFVEIPPHIAVSDFVRRVKGRSSHRVQMEFPELRKPTGDATSGPGATSAPQAATSQTMSYFSIFVRTNLPAPAGSYSVGLVSGDGTIAAGGAMSVTKTGGVAFGALAKKNQVSTTDFAFTPTITAGANVTVTGTWPSWTIAASGVGGGGPVPVTGMGYVSTRWYLPGLKEYPHD